MDLQLPVQSVLITTKVVSSKPAHGEAYLLQFVIQFVSDLQQVDGFLLVLLFPPPIKLTATLYVTLCDKVCQWLAAGRWFTPVSSTNKSDRDDIAEIFLEVVLNTVTLILWTNIKVLHLSFVKLCDNLKLRNKAFVGSLYVIVTQMSSMISTTYTSQYWPPIITSH